MIVLEQQLRALHADPQVTGRDKDSRFGVSLWNLKFQFQWYSSFKKTTRPYPFQTIHQLSL